MKYFTIQDFDCQETGQNNMDPDFLDRLDALREATGFPFIVTSGYRARHHSAEVHKPEPGTHVRGIAADIRIRGGAQRRKIVEQALLMGFTGIGIAKTFVHVDDRVPQAPVIWIY